MPDEVKRGGNMMSNYDVEDEDIYDDEETFEEDAELGNEEQEDDIESSDDTLEQEEPQRKPLQKDKITHALIEQKKANKELRQRLEAFENEKAQKESQNKRAEIAQKLIDKGFYEDDAIAEADRILDNESIKQTVKELKFLTEYSDVIAKYPDAKKNINKLMKLKDSTGWDIEKICKVEYSTNENAFDNRIKNEQETQLKKKKVAPVPAGGQTPIQNIKLDSEDEKAYQFYSKRNPGISRKQYAERQNAINQTIPLDKWY
jgi:hypothetical protein